MFIGHMGVGLALKRADRSINLAWLLGASLFLDLVLWILVFFEVEKIIVPANYAEDRYLQFFFPYSHGLLAAVIWSGLLYLVAWWIGGTRKAAFVIALAVFSHFVLDWIVHVHDLPLAGPNTPKLGLALWEHVMTAFFLEMLLLLGGLIIYFYSARIRSFSKRISLFTVMVLITILTYMGQMRAPAPEYGNQIAISSIISILLIIILAYWLDRESTHPVNPAAHGSSSN